MERDSVRVFLLFAGFFINLRMDDVAYYGNRITKP
jgi:hypothetical protein